MDKFDKYFQDALEKIQLLRKEKKLADAIELIEQELSSSYIPLKFVQTFEQLYLDVSKELTIENVKHKFSKMSKTEMLGNIFKDGKVNLNVFSYFLSKFYKELDQYDLNYFNRIFLDKNLSNSEKIFILKQLKVANINFNFTYFNLTTNEQFIINSLSDFEFDSQKDYCSVLKVIDNQLMKEPSLILLAKDLLQIVYEHFFNRFPITYSIDALANNLVKYVQHYFDTNIIIDKDFLR
jgi:hypothetical protein